jgi:diguanylate cyclase (GGDEF)-like protein
VAGALRRWWLQPSHYDWLSGYLHARGIAGATRVMMAATSFLFAACLVALIAGAGGPRGTGPVFMTWAAFAVGLAGGTLWTVRWPTPGQSLTFAVGTNAAVALACLAHPNPMASLIGCIAFATSGAYLAFFHTTKYVIYNFVIAAGVAIHETLRLASGGQLALAGVDLLLVLQINIAMPLAIQAMIRALGNDLVHADLDPLTGLNNRRAFQLETLGLVTARPVHEMYLLVAVVDLDDFKAVNDRDGHVAGDRVLVAVADALRSSTRATAVIARSGGEEFIVADTSHTADTAPLAQSICHAIAELPVAITASVGTACAPLHGVPTREHKPLVEHLVGVADEAMYRAKRSGGNGYHQYGRIA